MENRLQLHNLLKTIVDNVYFQPPPTMQIHYPCIIYYINNIGIKYANNKPYNHSIRYQVKVIDEKPDSELPLKVASLPTVSFNNRYTSDGLNHTIFSIYY